MLHNHVDSWHYEVDQLLLGTLMFTLVTFSLPTFLTYTLLYVVVCAFWYNGRDTALTNQTSTLHAIG